MPTESQRYTSGAYEAYKNALSPPAFKEEAGFRRSEPSASSYMRRFRDSWNEEPTKTTDLINLAQGVTPDQYKSRHPQETRNGPALNKAEAVASYSGGLAKRALDPINAFTAFLTRNPSQVFAAGAAQGGAGDYVRKKLKGEKPSFSSTALGALSEGISGLVGDKIPDFGYGVVGESLGRAAGNTISELAQDSFVPAANAAASAANSAYNMAKPYVASTIRYLNPFKEAEAATTNKVGNIVDTSQTKQATKKNVVDPTTIPTIARYM